MKKIIAFIIATVLFAATIYGYDYYNTVELKSKENEIEKRVGDGEQIKNPGSLQTVKYDEDSLLVLGSSELKNVDGIGCDMFPSELLWKEDYAFKMVLMGQGGTQSLSHAVDMVLIADELKNKKVVLLLSPQWFTESGTSAESFAAFFDAEKYDEILADRELSETTKSNMMDRVEELLGKSGDMPAYKHAVRSREVLVEHTLNPLKIIPLKVYNNFWDIRRTKESGHSLKQIEWNEKSSVKNEQKLEFYKLHVDAQKRGAQYCTNNDFGIYNEYYETYISDNIKGLQNSQAHESYASSPEYDDLRLFLDVCKEKNIEVMLVSIPVNGMWYDYTGFPKSDREQYYENIRIIAKDYNVDLADFSDKEYEKYFLRDIMHVGWEGWVYIEEKCYQFLQ